MANLKKIGLGVVGVLVLGIGGLLGGAMAKWDQTYDVELPDIKASQDAAIIARGEYLVWGPGHCAGCHGAVEELDKYEETGERVPLTGGFVLPLPPGNIVVPNITQDEGTGIGKMSDGEIARSLRFSVGRHGTQLFPVMPFTDLSNEDLTAIISYLRTVEPVAKERPQRELNMLGKFLFAFVMKPNGPTKPVVDKVPAGPTKEYGEYLAKNVANCYGCHTNRSLETGEFFGEPMGGGLQLPHKGKVFTIPNITATGEGSRTKGWDEAGFLARIKTGKPSAPGSPMPWIPASQMKDDDLKAIWAYISSLPGVDKDTGPALP
jgi:mono/diheme cytochrome c family protein